MAQEQLKKDFNLVKGDLRLDHLFQIMQSVDSGFCARDLQGHLNRGKGFKTAPPENRKVVEGKNVNQRMPLKFNSQ